jgi:hypothetical protein
MDYSKLVAVSGLPGLFELLNSKTDGAILRSLDDGSTRFVSSRVHNFSQLENIEVYTVRENVNLAEVFNAMKDADAKLPDDKDQSAIRKYFEKVYPDMDFDRVYPSDMKKMVKWYAVLKNNKVDIKLPEEEQTEEEGEETTEIANQQEQEEPKPKKKSSRRKKAE